MYKNTGIHVFAGGKVQGVFFRAFIKKHATGLGVCGWVRNTEDGRVEIVAEGERRKLIKLIELVRKGPPLAKVEKVDVSWGEATWEFQNFSIVNSV